MQELQRLREHDIVRLLDVLVVSKDEQGNVRQMEASDLPARQAEEYGAIVRALIGFGGEAPPDAGSTALDEEEWDVVDAIPEGTAAAVALLEHRWAIPLSDAITRAGGTPLADAWVHRDDLAAAGLEVAEPAAVQDTPSS
jgi:hypothetical protein